MLDLLGLTLCDMQGKLFVRSGAEKLDSASFIKAFMQSDACNDLDKPFSHMQWAGESYIFSRVKEENGDRFVLNGTVFDQDVLYWIGYIYRYWHYYTGECGKDILKQAPAETMNIVFLAYHSMGPEMAIDRLKETYRSNHKNVG